MLILGFYAHGLAQGMHPKNVTEDKLKITFLLVVIFIAKVSMFQKIPSSFFCSYSCPDFYTHTPKGLSMFDHANALTHIHTHTLRYTSTLTAQYLPVQKPHSSPTVANAVEQ